MSVFGSILFSPDDKVTSAKPNNTCLGRLNVHETQHCRLQIVITDTMTLITSSFAFMLFIYNTNTVIYLIFFLGFIPQEIQIRFSQLKKNQSDVLFGLQQGTSAL